MTGPQIIQLLDRTIDWYRTLGIQQQAASEPSDQLILFDNRQTANRVVAVAFEIARSNADILAKQPQVAVASDGGEDADKSIASAQALSALQTRFTAQAATVKTEIDGQQALLAKANAKAAPNIKAKIAELQSELDLVTARRKLLDALASFSNEGDANGVSAGALKAQIDAMAIAMPTAGSNTSGGAAAAAGTTGAGSSAGTAAAPATTAAPAAASPAAPLLPTGASPTVSSRFGIWDLAGNVFRLAEKRATITSLDRRTAALQDMFAQMRAPLIDRLKAMSAHGDALATQADNADAATLIQVRDQMNDLADDFKSTAAPLLPLSREGTLLRQYRRNLANWRDIITEQYHAALASLGIRVAILGGMLLIVFFAAEMWRRGVMSYIHDARRRYQLLLLRKIALWTLVVIIVGLTFASELSSIVTFAGLITAGIAVAMQSVLVSIVGYFFLIGKYGIRVGDRIQIGDVTGEVIELGLVRMHLAEFSKGGQQVPTGRVVAFANSVVFQVSTGLFKQIPGVNFTWHEFSISLPAGIDYGVSKERLNAALDHALQDSREEIVRQSREIQRTTASTAAEEAAPRVQLAFSAAGVEAKVRYPVNLQHAAEIDERVSRELSDVVMDLARPPDPQAQHS